MSKVFNVQPIEKVEVSADGSIDVHGIFPTIQGEGPFVGQPAVFVRLAGCNLQCPLCDTDYTQGRQRLSIPVIHDTILDSVTASDWKPLIVITGGEPFRQRHLSDLVHYLLTSGYRVQIETNGSLWTPLPHHSRLTIVCSPKSGKLNPALERRVAAFKYVLKTGDVDHTDGLPTHALDHPVGGRVARPPAGFSRQFIYVQPADTQDPAENQSHLQTAIQSARQFGYTLCLQTHKIIDLP